jgi:hypothetical protein
VPLWRAPLVWVTSTRFAPHRQDPLPLALADREPFLARGQDCDWAGAAVRALEQAGRRYRIAYTSASQIGTHAPVLAGLAVTVSTLSWLPEGLRAMRPEEGLPALPEFGILLLKAKRPMQPVTDALAAHIAREASRSTWACGGGGIRRWEGPWYFVATAGMSITSVRKSSCLSARQRAVRSAGCDQRGRLDCCCGGDHGAFRGARSLRLPARRS